MKAATAVLVTLLFGAGAAEAAWQPTRKLPRPIDYPIVRPKAKETHKQHRIVKHPPSYALVLDVEAAARA